MRRREVIAASAAAVVLVGLAAALRSGGGGAGELLAAAPSAQKEAARKRLGAKALAAADHSKTARELHDIEHDLKLSIKRLAPKAKQMALSAENGEEPAAEVGFASPPPPGASASACARLVRCSARAFSHSLSPSCFVSLWGDWNPFAALRACLLAAAAASRSP